MAKMLSHVYHQMLIILYLKEMIYHLLQEDQSDHSMKMSYDHKCCIRVTDKNKLSNLQEIISDSCDNTSLINPKEEHPNELCQQGKDCPASTAIEIMQENSVAQETLTSFKGTAEKFDQNTVNMTKCPNEGNTQITHADEGQIDNQDQMVPNNSNRLDLCDDDCLTETSLYSGLHPHVSEINVAHEKEKNPPFQWDSAYRFTPATLVKNSASGDTALSPIQCRPLRLGLSRRQKVRHLHNK